MPDKPAAERTEQPTPRRLEKARKKGQTATSKELPSFACVAVLMLVLYVFSGPLFRWCSGQITDSLSCNNAVFSDSGAFISFFNGKIISMIIITFPFFIALSLAVIAANLAVGGFTFSSETIELKFDEINPASGLSKLITMKTLVEFLVSIAKLLFVGLILWWYLHSRLEDFLLLRWTWSVQILSSIASLIMGMMIRICIALLVIALADVAYQKWKFKDELKMTKQEVKEERKETDGSPEVKSRIRGIQFEMARKRMLQEVPKATVILVNPTHYAVAVKYDTNEDDAPLLLAKGADHLAEKIREIGRAYGVPIVSRPQLTRTIYSGVKVGQQIPQALYIAVAEVLAVVYRMRKQGR